MSFLDDLLAKLGEAPADQHSEIIQNAITEAGSEFDTSAVTAEIVSRFEAVNADSGPADDAAVDALEQLAAVADSVTQHQQAVEQRAARAADASDRLRALQPPAAPAEPAAPAGNEPAVEPEPAAPATEQAAAQTPTAVSVAPTAAPAGTPAAAPAPAAAEPTAVAASVRPRVPLGLSTATPPATSSDSRDQLTLVAAGDISGFATGQTLSSLVDFGRAWEARMAPLAASQAQGRHQVGIARIRRESPAEFTVDDAHDFRLGEEVIKRATDETRLPGGSLVAAGGWCAPSETTYELCDIRITNEGMVTLPTITARRGGLRYPADFDWSALWSSAGFHLTEAESIAGREKTCNEVPCGDFVECRLDVDGVCIRTPILTERGWPERVAQFTEGVLAVHAHKLNAWKINRMVELSTQVTMPTGGVPDPTAAITDPHGPGAVESVLSMLELQVQYQRYRERLSQRQSLEMVAPYWLRGILKSDLRKKLGIDNRWAVSDDQLDTYLRSVGVNPQWVYDWQDAYAEQDETGFGGATVPTVWPGEVQILLYRAGSFFQLQADVISLDGVYDHASLVQNMYTSLFTEEGIQVCMRCGSSYVLTIPLCPNGLSGGIQTTNCAPEAV